MIVGLVNVPKHRKFGVVTVHFLPPVPLPGLVHHTPSRHCWPVLAANSPLRDNR